jgi:hypothetical protein
LIRPAIVADVPALLDMGVQFHRESIYADLITLDKTVVSRSLAHLTTAEAAVFLVADDVGEVTGAICGVIGPHYMTGTLAASELFWWIAPERRGHGLRLLAAYEDALQKRGVKFSGMIAPRGSELLGRVYDRRGYRVSETVYVKGFE